MKKLYCLFSALALAIPCIAQNGTPTQSKSPVSATARRGMVSLRTVDSVARIAFAKMASGTDELASLSNNVTVVPTDGKLSLSGNYFFPKVRKNNEDDKKKTQHFAIGFNAAGSTAGNNGAELFSGGKLNTGTDLGIKIHWRTNRPNAGYTITGALREKQRALDAERDAKITVALDAITYLPEKIQREELQLIEKSTIIAQLESATKNTIQSLNAATTDAAKLKCAEELAELREKIAKEKETVRSLQNSLQIDKEVRTVVTTDLSDYSKIDSPTRDLLALYGVRNNKDTYAKVIERTIREEYTQKQLALEMTLPIEGMHISWLSSSLSWNRAAYRTYYATSSFEQALTKETFNGLTAGLQWNKYTLMKPVRRASLFTIGLTFKNTNDLADFSTSKLTEESTVNGTSTRKLSEEYNVYTDPITAYKTWQVPVNYYQFFGENLDLGWHVFGLADFRNTKKEIYDVGAGFILGLNTAGTKKLFNIEVTTTYKDINRELIIDKDASRWKQLVIGLSVTVPFLLFKN